MARHHSDGYRRKIFSIILCGSAFSIIKAYGVKYNFGSTPGVVFQDGRFTLKTLLHLWNNHNFPRRGEFAYLVKDFDTSNQKILIVILSRYGSPPRFCYAIRRMYENSAVGLIIGKIDTSVPFKVGVNQGDIMAPVVFLFLVMAFSETLEKECTRNGLTKSTLSI